MWIPPAYVRCANVGVFVSTVILVTGCLLLGSDARDGELQLVAGAAFVGGLATMLLLLERQDRRSQRR